MEPSVAKMKGENNGPLTSLPVDRLNGDRLQLRLLVPKPKSYQAENPRPTNVRLVSLSFSRGNFYLLILKLILCV